MLCVAAECLPPDLGPKRCTLELYNMRCNLGLLRLQLMRQTDVALELSVTLAGHLGF